MKVLKLYNPSITVFKLRLIRHVLQNVLRNSTLSNDKGSIFDNLMLLAICSRSVEFELQNRYRLQHILVSVGLVLCSLNDARNIEN